MANAKYATYAEACLKGTVPVNTDAIKAILVRIGGGHYVPNFTTDQYLGIAVAGGDIVSRTAALSSKTTALGVFLAANTLFAAVAFVASPFALLLVDTQSAVDNTSPLICYIDSYAGLAALIPNGSDINLTWPTDANGIYAI